jgi:hypothetical protein
MLENIVCVLATALCIFIGQRIRSLTKRRANLQFLWVSINQEKIKGYIKIDLVINYHFADKTNPSKNYFPISRFDILAATNAEAAGMNIDDVCANKNALAFNLKKRLAPLVDCPERQIAFIKILMVSLVVQPKR